MPRPGTLVHEHGVTSMKQTILWRVIIYIERQENPSKWLEIGIMGERKNPTKPFFNI
jgi:hypothetical protein